MSVLYLYFHIPEKHNTTSRWKGRT